MKIMHSDLRNGEIKLKPENLDDLWYLSQCIDAGDIIEGKTWRKIKVGGNDTDSSSEKKSVYLSIAVEKVEFQKSSSALRASGTVAEGTDDIPKGSYHTFNIEPDTIIKIIKPRWPKYQLERLKEASEGSTPSILICVMDREDVLFAVMKKYGYEILSEFSGAVEKKVNGSLQKATGDFYIDIINALMEYDKRHNFDSIIIASPAFWKDELLKAMKDNLLKKKIHTATCSSVTKNAVDEVLKRDEVKQVLKLDRIAKETILVEQLFLEISRQGLAAYGLKETKIAVESGAAEKLLVTDSAIQIARESGTYGQLEYLMKHAESVQATITILSSDNEAGKRLDGLGGIAAILRFKLSY